MKSAFAKLALFSALFGNGTFLPFVSRRYKFTVSVKITGLAVPLADDAKNYVLVTDADDKLAVSTVTGSPLGVRGVSTSTTSVGGEPTTITTSVGRDPTTVVTAHHHDDRGQSSGDYRDVGRRGPDDDHRRWTSDHNHDEGRWVPGDDLDIHHILHHTTEAGSSSTATVTGTPLEKRDVITTTVTWDGKPTTLTITYDPPGSFPTGAAEADA